MAALQENLPSSLNLYQCTKLSTKYYPPLPIADVVGRILLPEETSNWSVESRANGFAIMNTWAKIL